MAVELLSIDRAREFVSFALAHDLQIQLYRREAAGRFVACLAHDGDLNVLEWSAESFDKIHTFLSQNDQQVHYHGATTVGVYAIVRLLGELRRALRDNSVTSSPVSPTAGRVLQSPSRAPPSQGVRLSAQRAIQFVPGPVPAQQRGGPLPGAGGPPGAGSA